MSLAKNIANSVFWRVIYLAVVFIVNLVVSRTLGAADSGKVFYLVNSFYFLILVTGFCLETGFIYTASRASEKDTKGLAFFAICWTIFGSMLAAGIAVLVDPSAGYFDIRQSVWVGLIYVPGILLTTYFYALFTVRQNYSLPNLILTAINLLTIVGLLVAYQYKLPPKFLAWIFLLSFTAQGLALAWAWIITEYKPGFFSFPPANVLRTVLVYGAKALAANLVFSLAYRVDYFFIQKTCAVCGPNDLGNYIQVSKLGQMMLFLPGFAATSLFPYTAANDPAVVAKSVMRVLKAMLLLVSLGVVALAVAGYWLFPFMYGETFRLMYLPYLLLSPGILSLSAVTLFAAYNAGINRVTDNVIGALIGLIVIVTGDWLLIPRFGINAAACVSSAGYIAYMLFLANRFSGRTGIASGQLLSPQFWSLQEVFNTIRDLRK